MRLARGLVVSVGACALAAGCGATPRQDVQAKVQQFAHSTAAHDYATLCSQVLAPALVSHLAGVGLSCQQAMKLFVNSVQNPTLSVARVTVTGSTASAVVLTGATGQHSARESIGLVDTQQGWRLTSLASPR